MAAFYNKGLNFSCVQCSVCCRHDSGIVLLSEKDVLLLVNFEKMGYNDFIETYCRWVSAGDGKEQLSLKEKPGYDCIFWDCGCSVYDARPLQCRAFPFWKSVLGSSKIWRQTAKSCPGMGKGSLITRNEIEEWLQKQEEEPVITRKI